MSLAKSAKIAKGTASSPSYFALLAGLARDDLLAWFAYFAVERGWIPALAGMTGSESGFISVHRRLSAVQWQLSVATLRDFFVCPFVGFVVKKPGGGR
jgi:hypothetical protein